MQSDDILFTFYSSFIPQFKNLTLKNTNSSKNGIALAVYNNSQWTNEFNKLTIDNFNIGVASGGCAISTLTSSDLIIQNCTIGLSVFGGSLLRCDLVKIKNNTNGIVLGCGGLVFAINVSLEGNTTDCNIAFNTLTPQGICFK
ncbi:TPA: hypothetical protein SG130_001600 [Campylobacter jejuni]|nr:hypothetical protein [Campylobacter jejuni]